jgi:hypothetical protein
MIAGESNTGKSEFSDGALVIPMPTNFWIFASYLYRSIILFSFVTPAFAQDKSDALPAIPKGPCWEIYVPNQTQPFAPMLLNKCDGTSFLLTKEAPMDHGKRTDSWIWRWTPLHTDQDEAVLSLPTTNGTLLTPGR